MLHKKFKKIVFITVKGRYVEFKGTVSLHSLKNKHLPFCLVLFSAYAPHTLVNAIAYFLANLSHCKQDGTKLNRMFNNGEEIQQDSGAYADFLKGGLLL